MANRFRYSLRTALIVAPLSVSYLALASGGALADARCMTNIETTNTDVVTSVNPTLVNVTGAGPAPTGQAVTDTTFDISPGGTTDDLGLAIAAEAIPFVGDADLSSTFGTFLTGLPDPVQVTQAVNATMGSAIATITPRYGEGANGAVNESSSTGANAFACGPGAVANGENASAFGEGAQAIGPNATATGQNAQATSDNATANGQNSLASGNGATAVGAGAQATANDSTALGRGAVASGEGSTAVGASSNATGLRAISIGDSNATATDAIAVGTNSEAAGQNSTAVGSASLAIGGRSSAFGAGAIADPTVNGDPTDGRATALGSESQALNGRATAVGNEAIAGGARSVAIGNEAIARGTGSVAIGDNAETGTTGVGVPNATAVGRNTAAQATGSVAIGADSGGNGAVASLQNEFVLGTANHTYTAGGITSGVSRDRQSGPLEVVTTDSQGHLASDGGEIFSKLGEHGAGIAIAVAMENPDLVGAETFGLAANIGFFDGNTALALSAMGVIGHNFMGGNERWAVSGGVGVSLNENEFGGQDADRTVAGRAGIQVSW
jgi:hypothetical protein